MENTKVVFGEDNIHGEVQLFSNDVKVGKMDISIDKERLKVYHTEVETEHRGKGFAKMLLIELVRFAHKNELRIVPLCPFVFAQFRRNPEEYTYVYLNTPQSKKNSKKYILQNPIKGAIGAENYLSEIQWRNGLFITDEPEKLGGKDLGPDPYTLLISSLVTCTLATLKMYIKLKKLDIPEISVKANVYYKIINQETIAQIERKIIFPNRLDPQVEDKLISIAESCPISKMLKGNIGISTDVIS